MNTRRLILLGVLLLEFSSLCSVQAQARRFTRRFPAQPNPAQMHQPTNAAPQQQTAPAPAVPATPAAPAVRAPAVVRVQPAVDPEKARAAKEEATRKAVEFARKSAEDGSETAQYELGMRYLRGDGVDKDEATARKWFEKAAKTGFEPASKKLEDLDHAAQNPKPVPKEK